MAPGLVLGADPGTLLGAAALVLGPAVAGLGYWLSRRSEREANDTQREAVRAKARLDEVEALRGVVETLTEDAERLKTSLHEANEELDKAKGRINDVNRELRAAQRNVGVLRRSLERNGVPIPDLEPMHDVPWN